MVDFLSKGITQKRGNSLFLMGPPGTGKTLLVMHVLANLKRPAAQRMEGLKSISTPVKTAFVSAIGKDLGKVFVSLTSELGGSSRRADRGAGGSLVDDAEQRFADEVVHARAPPMFVVVVDEVDTLDKASVLRLFRLAQPQSSLLLITIANEWERLLDYMRAEGKLWPETLPFARYAHGQLHRIMTQRLRLASSQAATDAAEAAAPSIAAAAIESKAGSGASAPTLGSKRGAPASAAGGGEGGQSDEQGGQGGGKRHRGAAAATGDGASAAAKEAVIAAARVGAAGGAEAAAGAGTAAEAKEAEVAVSLSSGSALIRFDPAAVEYCVRKVTDKGDFRTCLSVMKQCLRASADEAAAAGSATVTLLAMKRVVDKAVTPPVIRLIAQIPPEQQTVLAAAAAVLARAATGELSRRQLSDLCAGEMRRESLSDLPEEGVRQAMAFLIVSCCCASEGAASLK